jgi:serine/threonine-protein kinase
MTRQAGTNLGSYEILSLLGIGGMGEVYRARDTKLGRDIALKILPASFTNDPERVARFRREAQVLASLNHPHIAQIHGMEEENGTQFLMLELVDGESLDKRIARGTIPVDETLTIAKQIADALESAHEKGIIHRDLKPANIALTKDGQVKVLDFGLAKAVETSGSAPFDPMNSPTVTSPAMMTGVGVILGTAAYMAPEQAKGRSADKRSDVWAFGCVVYEMLTAKPAFEGEGVSDTLASVLRDEPDWTALPADLPVSIRALIDRCLTKDRAKRVADISTAQFVLNELTTGADPRGITAATQDPSLASRRRRFASRLMTVIAGSVLGGSAVWLAARSTVPPHVVRLLIMPPAGVALTVNGSDRDLAITPDGSRVVYVGANGSTLFVRSLDQLDATRLVGPSTPRGLFTSPDGQWVGFFDGISVLKRVAITGGPAVTVTTLDGTPRGATWIPGDSIIFATSNTTVGLEQVPAFGGEPKPLTRPNHDRGEADHVWPEALPGGRAVLFTITATSGGLDAASIAVLDLRTGAQTVLIRGGTHAHYVSSGHLVYGAAGMLRAVGFDLARLAIIGAPVPVVDHVASTILGSVDAVVAMDGTLAYLPGALAGGLRTLTWVDRQGRETPTGAPPRGYVYPRLSPDGSVAAIELNDVDTDVWLWQVARAAMLTRVTFEPSFDGYPVWTPDGRRLIFSSDRAGNRNIFRQPADRSGAVEQLTESHNIQNATSITPDGARLVFTETSAETAEDVMALRLNGSRQIEPLVKTPFSERNGEVSPDGRLLAYEANDSGSFEIYVRPLPDVNSARWQVSTSGGSRPLWSRTGQELFFIAPDGALMRAVVPRDASWSATAPTRLFEGKYFTGAGTGGFPGRTYDISHDGQQFLMINSGASASTAPPNIVVVQHFDEELKRLVPTK